MRVRRRLSPWERVARELAGLRAAVEGLVVEVDRLVPKETQDRSTP